MPGDSTQAIRPLRTRRRWSDQACRPFIIVAVAFIAAGLVGAPAFKTWSDGLADRPLAQAVRAAADDWAAVAETARLDRPYLALKSARQWMEALRLGHGDD